MAASDAIAHKMKASTTSEEVRDLPCLIKRINALTKKMAHNIKKGTTIQMEGDENNPQIVITSTTVSSQQEAAR